MKKHLNHMNIQNLSSVLIFFLSFFLFLGGEGVNAAMAGNVHWNQ